MSNECNIYGTALVLFAQKLVVAVFIVLARRLLTDGHWPGHYLSGKSLPVHARHS